MTRTALDQQDIDQYNISRAAEMAKLSRIDDIRSHLDRPLGIDGNVTPPPYTPGNEYAALTGRLQATIDSLLAIIKRDRQDLAAIREENTGLASKLDQYMDEHRYL